MKMLLSTRKCDVSLIFSRVFYSRQKIFLTIHLRTSSLEEVSAGSYMPFKNTEFKEEFHGTLEGET